MLHVMFVLLKLLIILTIFIFIAYMTVQSLLLKTLFERYESFISGNISYSDAASVHAIRLMYPPGFQIRNAHLCPDRGNDLSVVIAVFSRPSSVQSRNAIRKTWGTLSKRKDVSVIFFIGYTEDEVTRTDLNIERESFADVVQGNFVDSYRNLTLKSLSVLEWVVHFCPEADFLFKTDEDVFVHVKNLLKLISTLDVKARRIYGSVVKKLRPYRSKRIKYFVPPEQYKLEKFPDFISGPGYLMPVPIASELHTAAFNFPFLNVEDVLYTGIIARFLGIKLCHVSNFHSSRRSLTNYDTRKVINLHSVKDFEQFYVWWLIHRSQWNRSDFKRLLLSPKQRN